MPGTLAWANYMCDDFIVDLTLYEVSCVRAEFWCVLSPLPLTESGTQ